MNTITAIWLNEHPIYGVIHDSNGKLRPFPILAINEIPLNFWMNQFADRNVNLNIDSLVPAQGWLMNDAENKIAWELLLINENEVCSTIVPLLICPDDLDLTCIALVVEQIQKDSKVLWKRFGLAVNAINGVICAVDWCFESECIVFEKNVFELAVKQFLAFDEEY